MHPKTELNLVLKDLVKALQAGISLGDPEQQLRVNWLCRKTGKDVTETVAFIKTVMAQRGVNV